MTPRAGAPRAGARLAPVQDPVAQAERLVARIGQANERERRDALWSDLITLAREHEVVRPVISTGLVGFWAGANRRINTGSTRRAFAKLIAGRQALDELRTATIRIVRDEDAYPYPYQAPDAEPEDVKAYEASQRRIDANVLELRALWRGGPTAKMTRELRRGGERVLWAQTKQRWLARELGIEVDLDAPDVPSWMHSLPIEQPASQVDLTTFALTPAEARRVARDLVVLERNRVLYDALMEAANDEAARVQIRREREQVERTNDYRRMLGVPALGWSPRLHDAVRDHAVYLERSGGLGHDQERGETATFQLRASYFGYPGLVWENCHRGSNSARSALDAWLHSSAHHRTILTPKMTEMATGNVDRIWVQKFGLDIAFESEIQCHPWRD